MKFLYYDIIFLIIFCIFFVTFLIRKRKNLKVESRIFFLYPTKVGLKFINYVGLRYKKFFRVMEYIVPATGYLLMISSVWLFFELLRTMIQLPALFKVVKVPPIMPIFPYFTNVFKVSYLPPFYFTYWIVSIAIIAVVHEFAHGIFARHYKVRVKSTGFGFLGPFIAAFVEPDEKQLRKKSNKAQITVLAAGSFANLITTIVFIAIMLLFVKVFFAPAGVLFDTYMVTSINASDITKVGSLEINNESIGNLLTAFKNFDANYYDLAISMDSESVNLTKIIANNQTFFGMTSLIRIQEANIKKGGEIIVFENTPAIRTGLSGAINRINSVKINNLNDLKREMVKYKPGETINIEVVDKDYKTRNYAVALDASKDNKSQAILVIAFLSDAQTQSIAKGILSYARKIGEKLRDPHQFYRPILNPSLIVFIYNLIWWIIFLNISIALVNMLPLGIFDGGRVFYLSALAITKSKKKAGILFKIATTLILLIFAILTVMWFVNI